MPGKDFNAPACIPRCGRDRRSRSLERVCPATQRRAAFPVCRRTGNPQLRRVRRHRRDRLRHGQRSQVRQADPDVRRSARTRSRKRQRRGRQREDRPLVTCPRSSASRRSISRPTGCCGTRNTKEAPTGWRCRQTARRSTCRRSRARTGMWSIAETGNVIAKIVTNSGAHNTIYGPDGKFVYLAGLEMPEPARSPTRERTRW